MQLKQILKKRFLLADIHVPRKHALVTTKEQRKKKTSSFVECADTVQGGYLQSKVLHPTKSH